METKDMIMLLTSGQHLTSAERHKIALHLTILAERLHRQEAELVKLTLAEERMLGYGKTPSPKVCDKCREAVLTLREIFEGGGKMTNLEKIRTMSAEELAEFLYDITDCCSTEDCLTCPLEKNCAYFGNDENIEEWLLLEVEE